MKQVNVMQVDMVPGSAVLLYPYFHYLRGAQVVHASLPRRLDVQAIRFLTFRTILRLSNALTGTGLKDYYFLSLNMRLLIVFYRRRAFC